MLLTRFTLFFVLAWTCSAGPIPPVFDIGADAVSEVGSIADTAAPAARHGLANAEDHAAKQDFGVSVIPVTPSWLLSSSTPTATPEYASAPTSAGEVDGSSVTSSSNASAIQNAAPVVISSTPDKSTTSSHMDGGQASTHTDSFVPTHTPLQGTVQTATARASTTPTSSDTTPRPDDNRSDKAKPTDQASDPSSSTGTSATIQATPAPSSASEPSKGPDIQTIYVSAVVVVPNGGGPPITTEYIEITPCETTHESTATVSKSTESTSSTPTSTSSSTPTTSISSASNSTTNHEPKTETVTVHDTTTEKVTVTAPAQTVTTTASESPASAVTTTTTTTEERTVTVLTTAVSSVTVSVPGPTVTVTTSITPPPPAPTPAATTSSDDTGALSVIPVTPPWAISVGL